MTTSTIDPEIAASLRDLRRRMIAAGRCVGFVEQLDRVIDKVDPPKPLYVGCRVELTTTQSHLMGRKGTLEMMDGNEVWVKLYQPWGSFNLRHITFTADKIRRIEDD